MSNLKGILFSQYANEGMNLLIEEMQTKYKPKKGRRFNHNNITYEVSKPALKNGCLEFEISSKIPQDEVTGPKEMKTYFSEIKKIMSHEKKKPESIQMENIVLDSRRESEKERDYVKLLYVYALDDLFDDAETAKREKAHIGGQGKEKLPQTPSVFTTRGKLVLTQVRDNIHEFCREHITNLIQANKKVREILG
jgi:tRNA G37 N-methylase Trm5